MGIMNIYKNIDSIVKDAPPKSILSDPKKTNSFNAIPKILDEVLIDTDKEYPLVAVINGISNDKSLFTGTVKHGYFPDNKKNWINVGDKVEFSLKKIARIIRKEPPEKN
jgi:hypothetical protein